MLRAIRRHALNIPAFHDGNNGSVMAMTGILLSTIVMLAGGATDMSRAQGIKLKAQKTLDAAVLSVARSNLTDAEISERGPEIYRNWMQVRNAAGYVAASEFSSRKDSIAPGEPATVTATASIKAPTYFLGLFGKEALEIEIAASSLKPNPLPYEIALVLDVSGSMNSDLNGRSRLAQMKDATESLLDLIEESSTSPTPPTVSVVPYSTSVNLGDLPSGVLGGVSVGGSTLPIIGGDVWAAERNQSENGNGFNLSDASPFSAPLPFVTANELGSNTPITRLAGPSRSPAQYRAAVNGLTASGWTAGHLGMIWGVYALSPSWSSVWQANPAPYGEAEKVIVMLTDGQFNTTHNIGGRSSRDTATSNRYYRSACDLAKSNGIKIFTVALSVSADSEALLRNCARGSGGEMFSADSVESLNDAFETIARKIGSLRLSS